MNKITLFLVINLMISFAFAQDKKTQSTDKIKVLNFATFHFGYTSDATKTEFNEKGKKEQEEIRELSKMLAEFKPTIICVERPPKFNDEIDKAYQKYLNNPKKLIDNYYGEIGLVAFDVGRLSGVKKIYGIDEHMGYNYMIGEQIKNSIDSVTYKNYNKNPFRDNPKLKQLQTKYKTLSLHEKLILTNEPKYLDFIININADNLLYVGTENNFEGADEAGKFYLRNLRIYSNLNRIPMTKNDRVLIIMGGAHTAFLRELIKRSPKFEMVNTFDYLK